MTLHANTVPHIRGFSLCTNIHNASSSTTMNATVVLCLVNSLHPSFISHVQPIKKVPKYAVKFTPSSSKEPSPPHPLN